MIVKYYDVDYLAGYTNGTWGMETAVVLEVMVPGLVGITADAEANFDMIQDALNMKLRPRVPDIRAIGILGWRECDDEAEEDDDPMYNSPFRGDH